MPDVYDSAARYREELLALDAKAARRMADAYRAGYKVMQQRLSDVTALIEDAKSRGEQPEGRWLFQQERWRDFYASMRDEIEQYNKVAHGITTDAQGNAIGLGTKHMTGLMKDAFGPGFDKYMGTGYTFNKPNDGAMRAMIGFTSAGAPLSNLFQRIAPEAQQMAIDTMNRAMTVGANPAVAARMMQGPLGIPMWRSLTIARTETLRAYREAQRQTVLENADVLEGWTWHSARDARTCEVCWSMQGKVFDITTGAEVKQPVVEPGPVVEPVPPPKPDDGIPEIDPFGRGAVTSGKAILTELDGRKVVVKSTERGGNPTGERAAAIVDEAMGGIFGVPHAQTVKIKGEPGDAVAIDRVNGDNFDAVMRRNADKQAEAIGQGRRDYYDLLVEREKKLQGEFGQLGEFDYLVQNWDRNPTNAMFDPMRQRVIPIDHDTAFGLHTNSVARPSAFSTRTIDGAKKALSDWDGLQSKLLAAGVTDKHVAALRVRLVEAAASVPPIPAPAPSAPVNQAHLDAVSAAHREAIEGYLRDGGSFQYGIPPTVEGLRDAVNKRANWYLEGATVRTRIPDESTLFDILKDGRFKNQFDTGQSSGLMSPDFRARVEDQYFGKGAAPTDSDRPIYGYWHNPKHGMADVDNYGEIAIEFHDAIKNRTSFTLTDSLQEGTIMGAVPYDRRKTDAWLGASVFDGTANDDWTRRKRAASVNRLIEQTLRLGGFDDYVEAQMHGGVKVGDIRKIIFKKRPTKRMQQKLQDLGIAWEDGGEVVHNVE